jgi:hypothetical protein
VDPSNPDDDAQRWAASGLLPEQASVAQSLRFRPADVAALRRSSRETLDWPEIERRLRATVDAVRRRAGERPFHNWVTHGGMIADAVMWLDAGYHLSAAGNWTRHGITTTTQADRWRQAGFDPEPAARWTRSGIDDPRTARNLIRKGVAADDLHRLVWQGVPLDIAQEWLGHRFGAGDVVRWYDVGLTPAQVTALRDARMLGPALVGELLARDVPAHTIAELSSITGRTWAELRALPDADAIVELVSGASSEP